MLENVFETVVLKGNEYNIENITTISEKVSNKEYICEIDLDNMRYMFRCQNVTFFKNISFIEDTNTLVIEYSIKNENEDRIKFGISPLITYRDQAHMKKASYLKFGSRVLDGGLLVNLSITDNENLSLVCKAASYTRIEGYLNNVKHEINNLELKKDAFIEDLYLPGRFEVSINSGETKVVKLLVSSENISVNTKESKSTYNIEEENSQYFELIKLKKSAKFLENTHLISLPGNVITDKLFESINDKNVGIALNNLLILIKCIDGRHICLGELDIALEKIIKYINVLENIKNSMQLSLSYLKCKLWLVEIINKLYEKDNEAVNERITKYLCDSIKDILDVIEKREIEVVNNIEMVSLMYNAIKVYENVLKDPRYEDLAIDIKETIENKFWNEENRIMRQNIGEMETAPRVEMIYSICLSYPAVSKSVGIKVLDTIFRELYTPLGLRELKRRRMTSAGLIYPKYMAHFISANLSQNGNSYASKKIAYNLIKDLLLDMDKYVKDNVKYVYSEKGVDIDYMTLDYYTTCEMIRLYSMFM